MSSENNNIKDEVLSAQEELLDAEREHIMTQSQHLTQELEEEQELDLCEEEIVKLNKDIRFGRICTVVFLTLSAVCIVARLIAL